MGYSVIIIIKSYTLTDMFVQGGENSHTLIINWFQCVFLFIGITEDFIDVVGFSSKSTWVAESSSRRFQSHRTVQGKSIDLDIVVMMYGI